MNFPTNVNPQEAIYESNYQNTSQNTTLPTHYAYRTMNFNTTIFIGMCYYKYNTIYKLADK